MSAVLLDTNALIWFTTPAPMASALAKQIAGLALPDFGGKHLLLRHVLLLRLRAAGLPLAGRHAARAERHERLSCSRTLRGFVGEHLQGRLGFLCAICMALSPRQAVEPGKNNCPASQPLGTRDSGTSARLDSSRRSHATIA
jgi:hypothetical protein